MSTEYDFEKLKVYQEATALVQRIYEVSMHFPSNEQFGITSQLRRAALSTALNIAEGKGRFHTKVFIQFLYQARGSAYEQIALIKLSYKLKYLENQVQEDLLQAVDQILIKINNLIKAMK